MRFFRETEKATFLSRPNRFTLICDLEGKEVAAFLPNPGRLYELLIPGASVYLEPSAGRNRKLQYTAVAVERDGRPVPLHTHRANHIAARLIERDLVPGLEGFKVVDREIRMGNSRFDLLLEKGGSKMLLEIKSCTLFSKRLAMFPDAITSRGRRHVEELVDIAKSGVRCGVFFLVHSGNVEFFLPEYHTDLKFSNSLYNARRFLEILPLSIGWKNNLTEAGPPKILKIPWEIFEREGRDRGAYLLILEVLSERELSVGGLGIVRFNPGFYIYVGSAKKNLSSRTARHKRISKKEHWHIDRLRRISVVNNILPILSRATLECEIADSIRDIADQEISGFGSTDCSCLSHLFYFQVNPLTLRAFHDLLQYYRMDRPLESYSQFK